MVCKCDCKNGKCPCGDSCKCTKDNCQCDKTGSHGHEHGGDNKCSAQGGCHKGAEGEKKEH